MSLHNIKSYWAARVNINSVVSKIGHFVKNILGFSAKKTIPGRSRILAHQEKFARISRVVLA